MKLLLYAFEQLSILKINFHKSEVFCFGNTKEHEYEDSHFFMSNGQLPLSVLRYTNTFQEINQWRLGNCRGKVQKN
jgi:hypothetical protein